MDDPLAAADWGAIADADPTASLTALAAAYYNAADGATARGDQRGAATLEQFGHICSLRLRLDTPTEPYTERESFGIFRSATISDVTAEAASAFAGGAGTAANLALRARMADVAWVVGRSYLAALLAADTYLELAARHEAPDEWPRLLKYIERALQIAVQLGRANDAASRVRKTVTQYVDDGLPDGIGFRTARLLRLLFDYGMRDDAARYSAIAREVGEHAARNEEWNRAREYWELAATWAQVAGDDKSRRDALGRVADAYELEADAAVDQPVIGSFLAATHLQRAIEVLRRVGGARDRIDALHARMIEVQRGTTGALLPISSAVDIGATVEAVEAALAGLTLEEAFTSFAILPVMQSAATLRERAQRRTEQFLFSRLFPKVALSSEGKVIARQGSIDSPDPTQREAALRVEMLEEVGLHHQVVARAIIEPARRTIWREHPLRVAHLLELVSYHPAIPSERELLFAEGLYAGFAGDLPKAIHLLIPQLENMMRMLLSARGVPVSGLDQHGLQAEFNLNRLLYIPELREMLGDDIVFALQSLLVEKFGPDLRNRMAHGLMAYDDFFSGAAQAAWWLSFRIAMTPVLKAIARQPGPQEESGGG